jgi:hypothetical protein
MATNTISIPSFSHYVVLKDMKMAGAFYYRGQVVEPPPEWTMYNVQTLQDVRYIAPVPGEVQTIKLDVGGVERQFINQTFADIAAKALGANGAKRGKRGSDVRSNSAVEA